jgi:uncharacterized surface protein with fasciclin (FAS1) repeats
MNKMTRTALALGAIALVPCAASGQQGPNAKAAQHEGKSIIEVAKQAGNFNTLVTAIQAAGLIETLQGRGPFTVFAPNDAAFAKLPAGTIEGLLKDTKKLSSILTFHVLPGKVMAAEVLAAKNLKPATVNGATLDIKVKDGKVYVNGARVIATDITASNGVIHVIDAVVMPKLKK